MDKLLYRKNDAVLTMTLRRIKTTFTLNTENSPFALQIDFRREKYSIVRVPLYWKKLRELGMKDMVYVGEVEDQFPDKQHFQTRKRVGGVRHGEGYVYYWHGEWYISDTYIDGEDAQLIIDNRERLRKEKLDNEVKRLTTHHESDQGHRSPISEKVQIFVWNRDGGCCVKCGSQKKLEFDHIIPVSKGGSNTARNFQLLCDCLLYTSPSPRD